MKITFHDQAIEDCEAKTLIEKRRQVIEKGARHLQEAVIGLCILKAIDDELDRRGIKPLDAAQARAQKAN
ncbi:MAG: hypothetical protein VX871_12700 [Pseudomonadota bacterium]|nr:hypothetical protein [Pseudomonadota bacterium]